MRQRPVAAQFRRTSLRLMVQLRPGFSCAMYCQDYEVIHPPGINLAYMTHLFCKCSPATVLPRNCGRRRNERPETPIDRFVDPRMVVCRDVDVLGLVFARLRRHRASAAIVFAGNARPRAGRYVVGVVTKRAIAETVIDNYEN